MELQFDEKGLIPVITQDVKTKEVLMLAYANEEAIKLTLKTGFAHYWSRSRKKLWKKGETSGNVQRVVEIRYDCDCDALLYLVEQKGNACHTGNYSCFYRRLEGDEVRC
ncbi:phosphoribosyl-AMP cyclohydrolase [Archaeoglobus fulgidus]|jgi:phosphoribosyl-AMP cyclohydrolase|uniref:Phosphoribosyl-AMP cyclohydrolase n=2 Tax=Archaeoglobus fulgidus TaxID=2234 RepID=HIS3_ARCFU|nr:phosphoribosyl-AMP cyclohydrolase [Archaeoglobus fulgidus]O28329.1 RecName: Full=Phosphoribosyl-AMP cyclohydrolase; Short=PRA-CH [Archaeoglobus fulgidus DSM 4304]AAB89305.1 phosphoribosyl-AMP cyclohydrolase/phosphoribosyl-ATP pyrophosphohydrolase (hisIE) [Archaeoglobus fulgidus DSM 4304]AIG98941.1 Phosphoribosyl-AMP cyclohydrolase [Archaeoglobus fulgidus DSM 8774]